MQFATGIIRHTPVWAWILLAYLVWQGIKAMQPRTGTIWRALTVPMIFIVWGLSRLGFSQQAGMAPLVAWIVAALALLPVGVLTPRPFEVDHTTGRIKRPGSVFPLVRNIIVFGAQYSVAVIAAIHTDDRAMAVIVGRAISGATAGYFIGSTIALLRRYWKQRKADL